MPHQLPDSLLPGESLTPGEFLVSNDGRYRVYFEPIGALVLNAYRVDAGRWPYWSMGGVQTDGFSGTTFVPTSLFLPQRGAPVWRYQGHDPADSAIHPNYFNVENHRLVIQDDGNFVLYGQLNGNYIAQWASGIDPDRLFGGSKSVPPNTQIVEVTGPGQLAVSTDGTAGNIFNASEAPVGIRDGDRYVVLAVEATVPVAASGVISVDQVEYSFAALSGEGDTSVRRLQGSDGVRAGPVPSSRFRVTIGTGLGLSLSQPLPGPPTHHAPIRARDLKRSPGGTRLG